METLQFIVVFYLVVSYIVFGVTLYRNYDFYIRLSKKKTDDSNKKLSEKLSNGEITPMQYGYEVESYSNGYITFFLGEVIRAPIDAPIYLFSLMMGIEWNDEEILEDK